MNAPFIRTTEPKAAIEYTPRKLYFKASPNFNDKYRQQNLED